MYKLYVHLIQTMLCQVLGMHSIMFLEKKRKFKIRNHDFFEFFNVAD
jgi:hypothetical protein